MNIGGVLAQARHRAGLTVTQVSDGTGIGEAVIVAIERADFAACGDETAVRSCVRSIAMAVGADPEPLIEEYDSARGGPRPPDREITGQPSPAGSGMPLRLPGMVAPRERYRRRGHRPSASGLLLGLALVAGIGAAGYLLAILGRGTAPAGAGQAPRQAGRASRSAHPSPTAAAPAARILTPAAATAFGFAGRPGDNSDLARLAIDHSPATAWQTAWYATARFGNLYPGTGLLLDLGRSVTITDVRVRLLGVHGADLELRVGSAPRLSRLHDVAHAAGAGGVVRLRPARAARGRYALIWFTRLPPDSAGSYRESVYGVRILGRP